MAEEFGLERKESSTLGEKGGVVESREGSRGLTTVEGGEKGPIYSEEFGPVPLPTWIVFRVDLPPPSSPPPQTSQRASILGVFQSQGIAKSNDRMLRC